MKLYENSKLPIFLSYFCPIEIFAITVGSFIFCRAKISEDVLNHEKIHIEQWKELYYIGFIFLYFYYYLYNSIIKKQGFSRHAYLNIPFEKEAFQNMYDKDYLKDRKKFAWRRI